MKIITGKQARPRRILMYGPHGIGKSTWAASAWQPVIGIQTEDGLGDIGCDRFPLAKSFGDVTNAISELMTQDHEFKTVFLDSLDWTEKLVFDQVEADAGGVCIEKIDGGYGKGYIKAMKKWDFLLRGFDHLRTQKGMSVIFLAHARAVKVTPPDADQYDRWEPDLNKLASATIQEWCDEVFFLNYSGKSVIQKEVGFGKKQSRAVGENIPLIYTCEMPTHLAKRRIVINDTISRNFSEYAAAVKAAYTKPSTGDVAGDISGLVTNGSSKKENVENG